MVMSLESRKGAGVPFPMAPSRARSLVVPVEALLGLMFLLFLSGRDNLGSFGSAGSCVWRLFWGSL